MHIDSTRFLALVAAISATSCTVKSTDTSNDGGAGSSILGDGGETSAGDGGSAAEGSGGGWVGLGGSSSEGAGGGSGIDCLDDEGTPDSCTAPSCEGLTDFDNCAGLSYVKQGVAAMAVECLNALSEETCTLSTDVATCYGDALLSACSDAEADDDCLTLAPTCGGDGDDPTWISECHIALNGLTEDGRYEVLLAATEDCSQGIVNTALGMLVYYTQ